MAPLFDGGGQSQAGQRAVFNDALAAGQRGNFQRLAGAVVRNVLAEQGLQGAAAPRGVLAMTEVGLHLERVYH